MGLRIPPLKHKIMLGFNPLMSRVLVQRLAVSPPAGGARLSLGEREVGHAAEGALLAEQNTAKMQTKARNL